MKFLRRASPTDRSRNRRGRREAADVRELVVAAVLRNPLSAIAEPRAKAQLLAGEDVSFDELGLDSLARLTLAVDLDEHGFEISEAEINEAGSIEGLVEILRKMR